MSWLSAPTAVRRWFASAATIELFNPKEPSGPSMKTTVPGPKSQELMRQLDGMQVSWTHMCCGAFLRCLESIQP